MKGVHALRCHPVTPVSSVRSLTARVSSPERGWLAVEFTLLGDVPRLQIPVPRPPRAVDGLWQHTCFEAFIAVAGAPVYHELNFSPSGEWAAYAFRGYRNPAPWRMREAPAIAVRHAGDRLELEARLAVSALPAATGDGWALGLAAVVEEVTGALSYWALRHPMAKPDFHHRQAFALRLSEPGTAAVASGALGA